MKNEKQLISKPFCGFVALWLTQALSSLGSAMTSFALIVWSYQRHGSALRTALLSVCSYAPYVLSGLFAGTLADRLNKKRVMLACDAFAALCTLVTAALWRADALKLWHLYALNALGGLMNAFQQPASDVSVTLLVPKERYQLASALRSFSGSAVGMLAPALASALLAALGMDAVFCFDLATFAAAFLALLFFIRIPETGRKNAPRERAAAMARDAVSYLRVHRGILDMMLFLAAINLTASMYEAALPALLLPCEGETALGAVRATSGAAMLLGSAAAALWPKPKSRVRVVCDSLLLSMSVENFALALGGGLPVWCAGAALGWIAVPLMNANMDVIFRSRIPVAMQGRVYAARNTFQFFTIPLGYLLGGALVDRVFEPLAAARRGGLLTRLFGAGKGSGAAMLFLLLGVAGVATCLLFRLDGHIWALERDKAE